MMKKCFLALFAAATLFGAPQAIVFDFGGVLTREQDRTVVIDFIRNTFQFSEEEFEKVNQEKRTAVRAGKTDEEFWLDYANQNDIHLPENWSCQFKNVLKKSISVNEEMYALVDRLKQKGHQVALLSNIDSRLGNLIRGYGLYDPFDPCLLSFEIGMNKPDPKTYLYLLTALNLPPGDVVFIDDKIENINAAKEVGIDAILFLSQEQLEKELFSRL